MLTRLGFTVIINDNIFDSMKMVQQGDVELVITDIRMPVFDGFWVIKTVREMDQRVPIIAISAMGTKNTRDEAFYNGCTYFLVKPFDQDDIKNIIYKYLN